MWRLVSLDPFTEEFTCVTYDNIDDLEKRYRRGDLNILLTEYFSADTHEELDMLEMEAKEELVKKIKL